MGRLLNNLSVQRINNLGFFSECWFTYAVCLQMLCELFQLPSALSGLFSSDLHTVLLHSRGYQLWDTLLYSRNYDVITKFIFPCNLREE